MTIPRFLELRNYWQQAPPIHLLVRDMFAEEKPATKPADRTTEEDIRNFVKQFNGGV